MRCARDAFCTIRIVSTITVIIIIITIVFYNIVVPADRLYIYTIDRFVAAVAGRRDNTVFSLCLYDVPYSCDVTRAPSTRGKKGRVIEGYAVVNASA